MVAMTVGNISSVTFANKADEITKRIRYQRSALERIRIQWQLEQVLSAYPQKLRAESESPTQPIASRQGDHG